MTDGLAFYANHGRGMTLRERIRYATSLPELEDIRRGREDVARILRVPLWPNDEGGEYEARRREFEAASKRGQR